MFKFLSPWPNLLVTELSVSNMDKGNLVFLGKVFLGLQGFRLNIKTEKTNHSD